MTRVCVVLLGICLASTALAAELVVIESTSPDHKIGDILDAETDVELGEDTEIMLIAEDGLVITLAGPYVGLPGRDQASGDSDALDALGRLVGYAETEASDIGGVRGGNRSDDFLVQEVADHRTSPWLLHTAITGPQCVRADDKEPEYWREPNDDAARLEVKRVTSGEIVTVTWQAGDNTIPWPATLPLMAEEMYLLRFDDQLRSTNLLVREVPAGVGERGIGMVAFLAARGCLTQARLELERLRK